jgi:hypothetical protein
VSFWNSNLSESCCLKFWFMQCLLYLCKNISICLLRRSLMWQEPAGLRCFIFLISTCRCYDSPEWMYQTWCLLSNLISCKIQWLVNSVTCKVLWRLAKYFYYSLWKEKLKVILACKCVVKESCRRLKSVLLVECTSTYEKVLSCNSNAFIYRQAIIRLSDKIKF